MKTSSLGGGWKQGATMVSGLFGAVQELIMKDTGRDRKEKIGTGSLKTWI